MYGCHVFAFTPWRIRAKPKIDFQKLLPFGAVGIYVGKLPIGWGGCMFAAGD